MKRILTITLALAAMVVFATYSLPASATKGESARAAQLRTASANFNQQGYHEPLCQSRTSLCTDTYTDLTDDYVGHDEPSLLFKSDEPGSGNDVTYTFRLPREPKNRPQNNGTGGTWNFELRPTFWFGMTLCDTESSPEYTHTCTPDSDANNLVGTDPNAPDYIGKHPGNAYMELQFYGPGYVPQFTGFGCAAHQYCSALTIDSLSLNQNTGKAETPDCDNYILGGIEPINWAYITHNGVSQAPANPLHTGTFSNPNLDAVTPDYAKDLLMRPGDRIRVHMFDTAAGFHVDELDLTTGDHGSMTASIDNGFGHVLWRPGASTCRERPYAFHPEYDTASTRGNTWSAHTYNVAYSDEIGHFEHCLRVDQDFNCAVAGSDDPGGLDPDDDHNFCVPGSFSSLIHINGCFFSDGDWDGPSYQNDWPGTDPDPTVDHALHPTALHFTSATTNDGQDDYPQIAFETDLPRIEAAGSQDNPPFCNRTTGQDCVNPPAGAQFYPFYSTTHDLGTCVWAEGGPFIPGADYSYGSNSHDEFGPLLQTVYPTTGFTTVLRYNNFNSGDLSNGCTVHPA
ncbi:MAG: hypothetical protein ACJ77A_02170 [Actinomycetota bacterium]